MIHAAFTITETRTAHIIIKNEALRIVHQETMELPQAERTVQEWHACRAAVRQAAQHGRALRLYSDCSVIDDLLTVPEKSGDEWATPTRVTKAMSIDERKAIVSGWGKARELPGDGRNRERSLYFSTVAMLITSFPGAWDVVKVEQSRIVSITEKSSLYT